MPITATKELQTSTSSTSAYGMTIRSMSSRTSPAPNSSSSDDIGNLISYSRRLFCDSTSRMERLTADWTTTLESIRQMSSIRIKCLIGPSK